MAGQPTTASGEVERIDTDVLIVGGGAGGCFTAARLRAQAPELRVTILEKAHVIRSGCLAGGISSINAYITKGNTPESFLKYVRKDSHDLVRDDLVYSIAQRLNEQVEFVEQWGLPLVKDENGENVPRGRGSIKIRGERIKPILARAAEESGAQIINRVVATNFLVDDGRVVGVTGFGVRDGKLYAITAKAVICATGGASGIYRSTSSGLGRHKVWYSPFNAGAGYAMGLRAGAEMTTFEFRFIALRVKDFLAPTGVLAQGLGAKQVNARGENYLEKYHSHLSGGKPTTAERLQATIEEHRAGRGPCYMDTSKFSAEDLKFMKVSYLDMVPSVLCMWGDRKLDPSKNSIEITGSEPYVQGGHGEAGYWIDIERRTTLPGLWAIGDVAGGAPKKYASGAWAEGQMAIESILKEAPSWKDRAAADDKALGAQIEAEKTRVFAPLGRRESAGGKGWEFAAPQELEESLQKLMDEYAGGISVQYETNEEKLQIARAGLLELEDHLDRLSAGNLHELMLAHEMVDRVLVARVLVEHMLHRKETRWPCYHTRLDHPARDDANWRKFINSRYDVGTGEIHLREVPYEDFAVKA
ncbi:MAG: adenylyl-sulfate reductase subunit alpha [Chrysiogenetes bacterium]|nr:adenylyl-sulfate reductase subunit alpha [Chrysiogenetes bacterium]